MSSRFATLSLYVDPTTNASQQANAWRTSAPADATCMDWLAARPTALWMGDWTADPYTTVDEALNEAGTKLIVFVIYNIPSRDLGNWSAGGAGDGLTYIKWVAEFACGIKGRKSIVVLEPDALAMCREMNEADALERQILIGVAVDILTASGASVYIDAGDSNWIAADVMAAQLKRAGVLRAAGFALNVSHTETTANELLYAAKLRTILGTKTRFIIDTSRNGRGPTVPNEWCNPMGRGCGTSPTLTVSPAGLDGYLYIKPPGESDGLCNGGPEAGKWWPEYALGLVKNRLGT